MIARRTSLALLALALTLAPMLGGCVYRTVDIFSGSDIYQGTILSDRSLVETGRSTILLKPGARFAIRTEQLTQWLGQFDVRILGGEGFTAYLRTVPHDFDTTRGVAFRYAVDGCTVRTESGAMVPVNYNADNEPQTISFYNEADLLSVAAGCKRIYQRQSSLPATEYIIFETLPGSTVELRGISYFETNIE
ncbi:MAG: hypothetical protein JWQ98_1409 [Chlorobi bacterium]|nr:hypothetical protein [Chlorobiota bacterium]